MFKSCRLCQRSSTNNVGEYRYSSALSLTSALEWGGWSTQRPAHFTPQKSRWMSLGHSSVGIGTRYGLHVPGIESCWGINFPHPSRPVLGPPSLLYKGVPYLFPGGCSFRIIVAFSMVSVIEINEINPLEERPTTTTTSAAVPSNGVKGWCLSWAKWFSKYLIWDVSLSQLLKMNRRDPFPRRKPARMCKVACQLLARSRKQRNVDSYKKANVRDESGRAEGRRWKRESNNGMEVRNDFPVIFDGRLVFYRLKWKSA